MKTFCVDAQWQPKESFHFTEKELLTRDVQRANTVWKNPKGYLSEKPVPAIKDDEVLLKIGSCGICGSDLHMLQTGEDGYMLYPGRVLPPVTIGHEFSGEVIEVGKNVRSFSKGDLVCVEPTHWCGKCSACRMGMFNQCTNMDDIGFTVDGGFAEYAAVNEKLCYSINGIANMFGDKQKAMDVGAMIEPAAVAYNGMFVSAGGIHVGGAVAVFGAGPVGLAALSLAIAAGAATTFVFDTVPIRRQLAKKLGADYVLDPMKLAKEGTDPGQIILELTDGVGASTFIEASGSTSAVYPSILKALAINAKIIQLGMDHRPTTFDFSSILAQQGRIYGSTGQTGHDIFPSIIRLITAGRLNLLDLATDRFSLENIKKGLRVFAEKRSGKVLISPKY